MRALRGGALLVLAACGPRVEASRTGAAPSGGAAEGTFKLTDGDVEEVARDVAAARQLSPTRPVAVVRIPREPFIKRLLDRRDGGDTGKALSPEAAFLLGFNFIPEPGKRSGIATLDDVLKEQVVGYYDSSVDKVFIPDVRIKTADELLEQRAVLAHEVHHAIQAQRFPAMPKAASSDEALAQLSLIEGDAMVAMGALLGQEAGAPVGRTLRRIAEVTKRVPLATITRGEERKQLDRALELTRRRLEFPYYEGMLFVSDVYRAGGFPLVDKLYTSVPRSTEQILHPEKYLAGELPRHVADPTPLPGYSLVIADTLGELETRILFERCFDATSAERAAAGWAGDRYAVFVGPNRRLALAWVSAWDTPTDAEEVEYALHMASCWTPNALGLQQDDYAIGANHQVVRDGKLVAFVRGFSDDAQPKMLTRLFGLVGPEPKAKPITTLTIPPRVRLPEPSSGRLDGDVYQNPWLGVVGRVPQGMLGSVSGHVDFSVQRPDVLVRGGMAISTRITSDAENEKTFREVQDSFAAEVGKNAMQVEILGGGPVQTSLGAGIARSWRVTGSTVELRLLLVPICAGTGSIVFIELSGDPYARSVLDGWIDSFRWMHGRNITACDFLDPK